MYHYLMASYQQWCSGQDTEDIVEGGERFLIMVERLLGYDKDETRRYLVIQPWFKSRLNKTLL
jgi:hypothetical protein